MKILKRFKKENKPSGKVINLANFKKLKEEDRLFAELYEDAVKFAESTGEISISMLQRHIKIGYKELKG